MKKNFWGTEFFLGGASLTQKALLARHLAVMLEAGLPISEALGVAADSAKGGFKRMLRDVLRSVESGRSLSSALSDHSRVFSQIFINIVMAGEVAGTLPENLENIAEQFEKERELISKLRGAMIYPMVVLVAAFLLGLGLSFWVLPQITPLFEGLDIELPLTTKLLISFSQLVQNYGVFLLLGIVALVGGIIWLVTRTFTQPIVHWIVLRVPILDNLIKNANLARFSRILGMLLKSGIHLEEALDIASKSAGNYYYRQALRQVSLRVQSGTTLSFNLGQWGNLFPLLLTRMIRVGEESGKFEETLFYLAHFYESEVDNATKSFSAAVEPLLLLVIGSVVGFIALAIITPIYNLTGSIGG